jgi:hypothetical protein
MTSQPTPPPPVVLDKLELTDDIKSLVNGAIANGTPMIIAYVDPDGQPSLSFRGSTQVYSDNQLAIWVRNSDGGLLNALEKNPRITLFYRDGPKRTTIQFRGRGHLENTDENRAKVYGNAPESERNADPEQKGVPLIIDLDRVDGNMPGFRIQMRK